METHCSNNACLNIYQIQKSLEGVTQDRLRKTGSQEADRFHDHIADQRKEVQKNRNQKRDYQKRETIRGDQ